MNKDVEVKVSGARNAHSLLISEQKQSHAEKNLVFEYKKTGGIKLGMFVTADLKQTSKEILNDRNLASSYITKEWTKNYCFNQKENSAIEAKNQLSHTICFEPS